MLNKCNCGWDAKHINDGLDHFVMCGNPHCGSGAYELNYEMAEFSWNNQNPVSVIPPEDFEKRLIKSIVWMDLRKCDDPNRFLQSFETHFGFDLREVAKEQWGREAQIEQVIAEKGKRDVE